MAVSSTTTSWAQAVLLLVALPPMLNACPRSCSCPSPREIHCTFRHLVSAPRALPKDTERINLGYNSIQAVGASDFTGLRRLEMLMLHGNDIMSVAPGAFYHLRSLQILKLSYNKLKTLHPSTFEGLSGLARLHLDHNAIDFIEPFSFDGLTSLRLLQLEGNQLRDLHPHTFVTLSLLGSFWSSSLRHLHLADNRLEYLLPGTLSPLGRLELLSLHGNPWACDCHLQWLLEWNKKKEGVIKCKKERNSGPGEDCAACSSPQHLNNSQIFQLTPEQLPCERPTIGSPLRLREGNSWGDSEPDLPYTKDLELPLGQLTFMLSDSHGNRAQVACEVRRPEEGTFMVWENLKGQGQVLVNVTLMSLLECEIDREELQKLWRLVAYYYESPAILERGLRQDNNSRVTFQYSQAMNEDSPYFTDLKGHLVAEPDWLLQPRVTLQLNRRKTTTKKLVLNFSTVISKHITDLREKGSVTPAWAMIQRGGPGRIQAVLEGSEASLRCKVIGSGKETVEWMLPDLSIMNKSNSRLSASESNTLVINKASLSDSGLYHCLVRTESGMDVASFRLTVREHLLSPDSLNGKAVSVASGGSLTLPCSVSSVQPSGISWYLPGNVILQPSLQEARAYVTANGTLVINKVLREDAGEYSCLVSNLYGTDMLSHLLMITGNRTSEPLNVSNTKKDTLTTGFPFKSSKSFKEEDEVEGSGSQEIKRVSSAATPQKTGGLHESSSGKISHGNKLKRIKEGKRKLNKSVKELDPSRWARIVAKAHSKASTTLPPLSTSSTTTDQSKRTLITTLTIASPTTIFNKTPPPSPHPTSTITTTTTTITSTASITGNTPNESTWKHAKNKTPPLHVTQASKGQTIPVYDGSRVSDIQTKPYHNPNSAKFVNSIYVTPPGAQQVTPLKKPMDRHPAGDKSSPTTNPLATYKRIRPYRRRRPPQRRIWPINPSKNAAHPTIAKEQVTIIHASVNTKGQMSSNSTENDRKMENNLKLAVNQALAKGSTNVGNSSKHIKAASDKHLLFVTDKSDHNPPEATSSAVETIHRTPQSPAQNAMTTLLTGSWQRTTQASKMEKLESDTGREVPIWSYDKGRQKSSWVTTTQQTLQLNYSKDDKSMLSHDKVSPSVVVTVTPLLTESLEAVSTLVNSSVTLTKKTHKHLPNREIETIIRMPKKPDEIGKHRDSLSKTTRKNEDSQSSRSSPYYPMVPASHPWLHQQLTQRKAQIPNTQPPPISTFPWASSNRFHAQPSIQSSRTHQSSPFRPWPPLNSGRGNGEVTNRPEITALTVRPTAFALPLTSSPPLSGRSRLRNRYRQAQLYAYRLSQLGKIITPKPRISSPTPKPHQAPFQQKSYLAGTPASLPLATGRPHPTASVLYGSRWHYTPWGPRQPSTALPLPNIMGSGRKPRITSVNAVSVSILAEMDIVLPCEASGEPEPVLSWTKVSTGATIQASTKHGQRFEVLKNGTFVIKNVQLQDRGQYLCTAQNKVGTDRMVTTLAVLTQAPKITLPSSKDVSVYLGRQIDLACRAEGKPQAQVSWILPDRTFVRDVGLPDTTALLLDNGTLRIRVANFSSKGDYKCIASNAAGADAVTYHVHVVALPPSIKEEASESVVVPAGRSVYLHCTAKGEPVPDLKWSLPSGTQVKPSQFLGGRIFVFPNGTLYAKNTSPVDSGKYECSATNVVGSTGRAVTLDVGQEPFSPRHAPSQPHAAVTAMYGSTVYLHCPESASGQRGALWRLPSKTLLDHRYSLDRPVTAFPNGTLRIQQLTKKDGGSYFCMFQSPNGEEMKLFLVEVLMKPPKIEHLGPAQKRVMPGDSFRVDCLASGLPNPEVSWSLPDGTTISNALQSDDSGIRSRRYVIFGNGTLLLQQMDKRDEGDYTCSAKNDLGEDKMMVSVKVVNDSPKIISKDKVFLWGRLGEPAHMKCEARGNPPPTVIWLSPTNEIITSSSIRYQVLGDGTLVIRRVGLADRGKYACVARNSAGDDIKNVNLEVEARGPQIIGLGGEGRTGLKVLAVSYQTKMLDCNAEGMPEPSISWTTSNGLSLPTPYQGGRFHVHQNGSLELRSLRKTDEGRFVCQAKNNLGEARLEIDLEVSALAEKPSFAMPNIEFLPLKADGSEITLDCLARGKPAPEFVWVLPNRTVLNPGTRLQRFFHHLVNGTLRIAQPAAGDKGVYRCLAKNVAGQAEKQYALEPGRKPQIRGTSGPIKISLGQDLNLPCSVDAWPQATISWTLPNSQILDKPQVIGRVIYLANGTLHLREIATFDRGTYICKATNTFGSSMLSYPVAVMVYPPRITDAPPSITRVNKGTPVRLNCVAVGTPKPDISWTLPGRTTLVPSNRFTVQGGIHMTVEGSLVIQNPVLLNSGIYKCNARNALGTDFKATYLQVT